MHDECPPRAELGQHVGQRPHERGSVDADHLRPRPGRVRQRAEHVEHSARGELSPHRRRVAHRRMVCRCKQEAEAELVDRALDPGGRQLEPVVHTRLFARRQRLERVVAPESRHRLACDEILVDRLAAETLDAKRPQRQRAPEGAAEFVLLRQRLRVQARQPAAAE